MGLAASHRRSMMLRRNKEGEPMTPILMKTGARAAFALTAVLALAPRGALAAGGTKYPWNVPDNVRVVQATPVDGVRTFSTIQAAIDSVSTASATNRFVIQVMAGTYTESLVMKDYVANPVITAGAPSMVAGFSVQNLTIVQRVSYGVSIGSHSDTITFRNVTLKMPSTSGYGISAGNGALEIHDSRIVSTGAD